jgi:methyl-accepting chemotaxis protein
VAKKDSIGPRLVVEGEAEFKRTISDINKNMSVLDSELKKVSARFDGNADSMDALTAKQDIFNRRAAEQREKVSVLSSALEKAKKEFGENSDQVKNWQIKLNNAEADLAKTEKSLKDTTEQIDSFGKEAGDSGDKVERAGKKAKGSGDDAEKGEGGWSKLGKGLQKAGEFAAKAAAALGTAAIGAATGIAAMTVKAAQSADDINTLAKQTGLSTEQIQKFQYASSIIDVDLNTLTGSMAKLTRSMSAAKSGSGDAARAFAALGISVKDKVTGELRNNQEVFNEAIAALGKMKNETQRDAYAMAIFGKSAQELNPLIEGGAEQLARLGEEAEKAGIILSQDSLDNLNMLTDAMDRFKGTASGAGSLFSTAFAGPMAEGLNMLTGYMTELTGAFKEGGFAALSDKFGEILTDVTLKINEYLPKIVDFGLNFISKLIEGITQNIPLLVQGAVSVMMSLTKALLDMLPMLIDAGLKIIAELALGIAKALPKLIPTIIDTILTIVDTLIDNISLLVDAAIAIIVGLAEGLITALPELIKRAPEIIIKLVTAIFDNLPKVIEAGIGIILALAGALITALPQLIKRIPEIITAIVNSFKNYIQDIKNIGKDLISNLWEGISGKIKWLKDKISEFFGGVVDTIKGFLGINSPSKLFAGIGENMALGLGKGFEAEMNKVSKQINSSVPASIDVGINGLGNYSSGYGTAVSNLYLDSTLVATAASRVQYRRSAALARTYGVVPG